MFDEKVKRAQRALEAAERANKKGQRNLALNHLQKAMDAIQGAGVSLDGVAPKEVPMLPDHEMWGWPTNGGRG